MRLERDVSQNPGEGFMELVALSWTFEYRGCRASWAEDWPEQRLVVERSTCG